jgi:ComF family protein
MAVMWQFLIGSLCVLCRAPLSGLAAQRQLCQHCLIDLPWLAAIDDEAAWGGNLPPPTGSISRQVAPLQYAGAAQHWVLEAKREHGLVAAQVLGRLLAEAVQDAYLPVDPLPDIIVPVPLSWQRLLRRGHNQAALIATPVARLLGIPVDRRTVRRKRHSAIQPGLTARQRRLNMANVFHCRRRFTNLNIAIVDDVVTSGATAESLASALLQAGASEIHLWCPTRATATATLPGYAVRNPI